MCCCHVWYGQVQLRACADDGVAGCDVHPQGGNVHAEGTHGGRDLRLRQDAVQQGVPQQRVLSGEPSYKNMPCVVIVFSLHSNV